jgi:hypothetical protein
MAYLAAQAKRKDLKHLILLYRLANDADSCYKFCWNYTGVSINWYKCYGCCKLAKLIANVKAKLLNVTSDYEFRLSDSEALNHVCQLHQFSHRYLDSI